MKLQNIFIKRLILYTFLFFMLIASLVYFFSRNEDILANIKDGALLYIDNVYASCYNKTHKSSDIDIVYTWVDGNDPVWLKEKNRYAKLYGLYYSDENSKGRFVDNEELKYSLRSLEKYAPWINKVYIVTNGQIPKWLNLDNPRVKIVTHDQIMPKYALPTFNSMAIEANLAHIPDLSEKFLYSNDDTFFGNNATPSFFFSKDGKTKLIINMIKRRDDQVSSAHIRQIQYSFNLLYKDDDTKDVFFMFSHNITPYLKSYYQRCEQDYKKEFEKVTRAKFRQENTIQKAFVSYYMEKHGMAIFTLPRKRRDAYIQVKNLDLFGNNLKDSKPVLFCLNDTETTEDDDRLMIKPFLEELFPKKSSFEK